MGKIIYKTTLNRYLVQRASEWLSYTDEVTISYKTVGSYGERADAIAKADELQRDYPDEKYVVVDTHADSE